MFWLPALSKVVGVFFIQSHLEQVKNSLEGTTSQALILFRYPSFSLSGFLLSLSISSNSVAISTVHHSHRHCPWHNWARAK